MIVITCLCMLDAGELKMESHAIDRIMIPVLWCACRSHASRHVFIVSPELPNSTHCTLGLVEVQLGVGEEMVPCSCCSKCESLSKLCLLLGRTTTS